MNISDIPWRTYRNTYYWFRRVFFTIDAGHSDLILPNTSIDELRDVLRKSHFGNGRLFSYRYKGEDLNMYRPEYVDDEWEDYQTHARGFREKTDKGGEYSSVDVHHELDPRSDGQEKAHIKEVNMSTSKGVEILKGVLDEHGIDYIEQ